MCEPSPLKRKEMLDKDSEVKKDEEERGEERKGGRGKGEKEGRRR